MQKRYQLSLRSHSRLVVDQRNSGGAAAVERGFEIPDLEADVMNCRPAPLHELPDRRIDLDGLEELDERTARIEAADPCAVQRRKLGGLHPENVPVKRKRIGDRPDGNPDVRNSDILTS